MKLTTLSGYASPYALTFSAITLRLMQFGLAAVADISPEEAYGLIAWPSWLLNWFLAEVFLSWSGWFGWFFPRRAGQ